jgi:hypothetical protein
MTTNSTLTVSLEAQGALPNFRYDLMQPLVQGRVPIEGVTIEASAPMQYAGYFDNPKFKDGDFGLVDVNIGDVLPAIEAGWDMVCLPLFIKRKPVYNFLWVRADRGHRFAEGPRGQDAGDCRLQQLDLDVQSRPLAALLRRRHHEAALALSRARTLPHPPRHRGADCIRDG